MVKLSILYCFLKNESDEVSSICTYKKDMKKESKRMTIQKVSLNLHAKRNAN